MSRGFVFEFFLFVGALVAFVVEEISKRRKLKDLDDKILILKAVAELSEEEWAERMKETL